MQVGVYYPQSEIESDPGAVAQFAQAAEDMGFAFIEAPEHVLGANRPTAPGTTRPYTLDSEFHDPFVLFAYLAGVTRRIGFATGILILPQRQAVLVAKQAACLDVLSNGRFRMGIGTGWNEPEYEALGVDYATRGKRIEEQVEVMRALWTNRAVTFEGQFHTITDAGIYPLPVQRPIPVWFGGGVDRASFGEKAKMGVLRRIARMGDGWIQQAMPRERAAELIGIFHEFVREYGRDPATVGIESRLNLKLGTPDTWAQELAGWSEVGMTSIVVNTTNSGHRGVDEHLRQLQEFRKAVPAA